MPASNPHAASEPWLEAWKNWVGLARSSGGDTPPGPETTAGAVSDLAAAYVNFANTVQDLVRRGGPADVVARLVAAMTAGGGQADSERQHALYAFLNAAPLTLGSKFLTAALGGPQQRLLDTLSAWASEFLDLPSVGPQREWQEALKRVNEALLAQDRAARALAAHYEQASATALDQFAAYLKDESGAPITSIRALYDAWIEHAEAAHADRLMSAEFARDFAAWVNAGSHARTATHALAERIAGALDVPQRAEINALLERQRRLNLEVESLRAELERLSAVRVEAGPEPGHAKKDPRTARRKTARAAKRSPKSAPQEFDIERILGDSD